MLLILKNKKIQIAIAVVLVLVAVYFYGKRKGEDPADEVDEQLARDIAGGTLTYDVSQYNIWADTLHEEMKMLFNDESDAIETILRKMRTKSDVLQLVKSFGYRPSWSHGVGTGSLARWITKRNTDNEIAEYNLIFKDHLIDFQF